MKHSGSKPYVKPNGGTSSIYLMCDVCGESYDGMWPEGCQGAAPKTLTNEGRIEALESRVTELERWRQQMTGDHK